jgi:glycosyltransferase involved in cell wall biosynthesis
MALVSVIMPVFNGEKYLREAVGSICGQSYKDFEFIIVDDGSSDRTAAILREYALRDDRLRVLSGPNTGLTRALLKGMDEARGDLIARMDADDVSLPRRLEQQVQFLDQHPECVAVGARVLVVDSDGDAVFPMRYPSGHEEIDAHNLAGKGCALAHPATMFRRTAYEKAGGYRPEFEPAEDLDLWLRMAEVGKLANLDDVLLNYRVHLKSTCVTRRQEQYAKALRAIQETCRRRGLTPPGDGLFAHSGRDAMAEEVVDQMRSLASLAWESGNYRTARKHASRLLLTTPLSFRSWKVAAKCALGSAANSLVGLHRPDSPAGG